MPATARSTAKKPAKTPAAKKPAPLAKQTAKTSPAKTAKPAAAPARKRAAPARHQAIPSEQRRNYIEVAAYYIAERHGFMPGRELADWAAAEAEIDRLLAEGRLSP